jgi:hypothetical protein
MTKVCKGPKTQEGLHKCKMSKWKHGRRSREAIEERKHVSKMIRDAKDLLYQF